MVQSVLFRSYMRGTGSETQETEKKAFARVTKVLQIPPGYVLAGSGNSVPLLKLLNAKQRSVADRDYRTVLKDYHSAIAAAARCGFRLVKAIACERTALFLLKRNEGCAKAMEYLQLAWIEYTDLGAKGKLSHTQEKYKWKIDFSEGDSHMHSSASKFLNLIPFVNGDRNHHQRIFPRP